MAAEKKPAMLVVEGHINKTIHITTTPQNDGGWTELS